MIVSHHSHSGQFCNHATHTLEEMILAAKAAGFKAFALTEHMPRDDERDLYPGEADAGYSNERLAQQFEDYVQEAHRLKDKHASEDFLITIGFEGEWIRPSNADLIRRLLSTYPVAFFIGSVHHVHTIPIDYSAELYRSARDKSGGTDLQLFEDYFDSQLEMLQTMKPAVVGHFDLIRLYSDCPDQDLQAFPAVWEKVIRNLGEIASYGGLLEINTAALRKGMDEPYPRASICSAFMQMGGAFTLSDDSHSVDHIGTNYARVSPFLSELGIAELSFVQLDERKITLSL